MKNFSKATLATLTIVMLISCKKLISVDAPDNQLTTTVVFTDSISATAALLNNYALFCKSVDGSFNINAGLYSDELNTSVSTLQSLEFLQSTILPTNNNNLAIWQSFYAVIYPCNSLINQLRTGSKLNVKTKNQLAAEAKFLRAYCYFYLVNLYGDVPLNLSDDVNASAHLSPSSKTAIYAQIVKDLSEAENTLPVNSGTGTVRAGRFAVTALLARTYLYLKNYSSAEQAAARVIDAKIFSLVTPTDVFSANNAECILQFASSNGYLLTTAQYIPLTGKPVYYLKPQLVQTFEPGDLRKSAWIKTTEINAENYYYPYKYHNRTTSTTSPENLIALRLGEQYLIRAEAFAKQNKIQESLNDLNTIRQRAGLQLLSIGDPDMLAKAILQERQVELFSEWGNRFFDLKRADLADTILSKEKSTWVKGTSLLFPIPQNEITYDHNLSQNPGY